MYFPILKNILSNTNIYEVRNELDNSSKQISELKTYIKENENIQNREILKPLQDIINFLSISQESIKIHLDNLEKEEGCSVCGAQSNEDCRQMNEVGFCPSWEDFKESMED